MEFRKIFDQIPEQFDRFRPRYCDELFGDLIEYAQLRPGKSALEVGPGTGQATEPILKTGCSYLAVELGENFTAFMSNKFSDFANFSIINANFETHDFGNNRFDLLYAATAFHWIPEDIGYPKAYELLKSGGTFAIFTMRPDMRPGGGYTDEPLYTKIQEVYAAYYHPEMENKWEVDSDAREKYGFVHLERHEYRKTREYSADDYVSLLGTNSGHMTLQEPNKSKFFEGIRNVVMDAGNTITLHDKVILMLARKP